MAVYKRPGSKYYWMKFTFSGHLIQQSTKCKNRRDAETVESAYRTQLALGKVGIRPKKKPAAFEKAANDYLEWSSIHHSQKPATIARIQHSTKPLVSFFGAPTPVDRIEKIDVERFVMFRSKQVSRKTGNTITSDTINFELITLKTIFKRLVSDGTLRGSPAKDVKQLPPNDRGFHVITDEEERLYFLACSQPLQDVVAIMIDMGLRPKEVYELNRNYAYMDQGFVQIVGGKTKSSNRRVWLTERSAAIIKRRMDRFKGDYLFSKGEQDHAGPTHPLSQMHKTAKRLTSLEFRIYDCRHTFATRALENGTDLLTLAHILGHSSLDQVMRYTHPSEARKREAMLAMEKGMAKAV